VFERPLGERTRRPPSAEAEAILKGWRDFRWMVPDQAKPVATLTLQPSPH
jgi:hypothetical protein